MQSNSSIIRVTITQSELFSQWPECVQLKLIRAADTLTAERGTVIHHPDSTAHYLFIIASGSMVFSRQSTDTHAFTMGRHVVGDFHGLTPVLTHQKFFHFAVCRERTVLVRIPAKLLRELVCQDGNLAFSLFSAMEKRHYRVRDLYASAALFSTRARIAELLKSFSVRAHAGRFSPNIDISQDEIAAMVGTRRQVVNRLLREMVGLGVLATMYGKISIVDFDKLDLLAEDRLTVG